MEGIATVVQCASSPIRHLDVGGTELLIRATKRADVSHSVSVDGIDHNPRYFYYPFRARYGEGHRGIASPADHPQGHPQFCEFVFAHTRLCSI